MDRRHAWFLNLDAEDELARPAGYTPSRATLLRIERHSALLRGVGGGAPLLRPGDIVVGEAQSGATDFAVGEAQSGATDFAVGEAQSGATNIVVGERESGDGRTASPKVDLTEFYGMAWCPTPRARRALARARVIVPEGPELSVLRAVNHRRFNALLGQTLPGAVFVTSAEEVRGALSASSPTGKWLVKRPYGYAGRGRVLIEPSRPGDVERTWGWIEASLRGGEGVQIEPLVERRGDFGLHGHLDRAGRLVLGEPTRQTCDASGAWSGSVRAEPDDLESWEREALFEEAARSARALCEAGYFGPFGVDAFRYEDAGKRACFNARCEINARYSMGWAAGMGDRRPDLDPTAA